MIAPFRLDGIAIARIVAGGHFCYHCPIVGRGEREVEDGRCGQFGGVPGLRGAEPADWDQERLSNFACGACGFTFVHPYPTADQLTDYYASTYRDASAGFYPKLKSRKRRALVKSLRFFRHVRGRKVLDIGCGGGVMVEAFRRLGADAHGVDISGNSIEFARRNFPGCTFYCENFDAMSRRDLRFDFMFSSELMEHIAGPHGCLAMIDALSGPGRISTWRPRTPATKPCPGTSWPGPISARRNISNGSTGPI